MTTDSEKRQRELLDEAGQTLMRVAEKDTEVGDEELDKAFDILSSIEQHPASPPMGQEAAEKLDQLNRARSLPLEIEK